MQESTETKLGEGKNLYPSTRTALKLEWWAPLLSAFSIAISLQLCYPIDIRPLPGNRTLVTYAGYILVGEVSTIRLQTLI